MITYKDCPDCGMLIRANVNRCEICLTRAVAKAEDERDLYKTRLAHAEADAEQAVAILTAERDLARELLANVFDRYACAACSHGKTGPECPCGFHAAGAYLDRTEKP